MVRYNILYWQQHTGCLSSAVAKCWAYGVCFTLNSLPSKRDTSSSGLLFWRWTSFILLSTTIWGWYSHLSTTGYWFFTWIKWFPHASSNFHSHSGGILIPSWGQAGQNTANAPGMRSVIRSWAWPARMRLWRSCHSRETRRRSRYRSYKTEQSMY